MSQLSKSLEKRIQELTDSIEAQKTELAAYQHVLHLELSKSGAPAGTESGVNEDLSSQEPSQVAVVDHQQESKLNGSSSPEVNYKGNKTSLVADIVKTYGNSGATPKDVDAFFTAKNIQRSQNLIYNTLSYLVAHNKLVRREGRYYPLATATASTGKASSATPAKAPSKRKISPEGLKRIKDALKKRWADKRAAEAGAGRSAKKKTAKKAAKAK